MQPTNQRQPRQSGSQDRRCSRARLRTPITVPCFFSVARRARARAQQPTAAAAAMLTQRVLNLIQKRNTRHSGYSSCMVHINTWHPHAWYVMKYVGRQLDGVCAEPLKVLVGTFCVCAHTFATPPPCLRIYFTNPGPDQLMYASEILVLKVRKNRAPTHASGYIYCFARTMYCVTSYMYTHAHDVVIQVFLALRSEATYRYVRNNNRLCSDFRDFIGTGVEGLSG